MKKYFSYVVSAITIYFLIFLPSYFVPVHSDDYHYFLQGLSFNAHLQHYLNWSGRFITDYTSSLLLNLFSKPIYMAINSLVFLFMLMNISFIPSVVKDKKLINKNSCTILWIVFFMYWLCNPNLGATSFWLVGSANYLWTIMWASLFITYYFYLLSQKSNKYALWQILFLCVLGFFAGLSNEVTGSTVVLLSFLVVVYYYFDSNNYIYKFKSHRTIILVSFLSSLVGFLILLLAPGNYKRLAGFPQWKSMGFLNKIYLHVFERVPWAFSEFWFAFIIIITLLLLYNILHNNEEKSNTVDFSYAGLFFVLSVVSVIVLIPVPYLEKRTLNNVNFYLVLSLSFLLSAVLSLRNKKRFYCIALILGLVVPYFVLSWIRFSYAVIQTNIQAKIREKIIMEAKVLHQEEAIIPDWYFTKLVKTGDKLDLYRSEAMAPYYKINKISYSPAYFNYAIIGKQKPLIANFELINDAKLSLFYYENNRLFDDSSLIFELNKSPLELSDQEITTMFFHLYTINDKKIINMDKDINSFMQMGNYYYYVVKLQGIKFSTIRKIDFGLYNNKLKKNYALFSINLQDIKHYN